MAAGTVGYQPDVDAQVNEVFLFMKQIRDAERWVYHPFYYPPCRGGALPSESRGGLMHALSSTVRE